MNLVPIGYKIRQKLLPKMLGREISDLERDVFNFVLLKVIVDQEEVYTASSSLTNSGKEILNSNPSMML